MRHLAVDDDPEEMLSMMGTERDEDAASLRVVISLKPETVSTPLLVHRHRIPFSFSYNYRRSSPFFDLLRRGGPRRVSARCPAGCPPDATAGCPPDATAGCPPDATAGCPPDATAGCPPDATPLVQRPRRTSVHTDITSWHDARSGRTPRGSAPTMDLPMPTNRHPDHPTVCLQG
jgi:hypothetical protein